MRVIATHDSDMSTLRFKCQRMFTCCSPATCILGRVIKGMMSVIYLLTFIDVLIVIGHSEIDLLQVAPILAGRAHTDHHIAFS